jgi:cyclin C
VIAIVAILLALVLRPNTTGLPPANVASNMASATAALSFISQAKPGNGNKQSGGPKTKVQKLASWLAESNIDIEGIVDSIQEIISLYEVQEQYNEKLTREQINRVVKARGLDK